MYFNFEISREDERAFPQFKSVQDARAYFSERYGSKYNYGSWEHIEGIGRVFFDDVDGQPVQIYEDGRIHVCY